MLAEYKSTCTASSNFVELTREYCEQITLTSSGTRKTQKVDIATNFIQQHCLDLLEEDGFNKLIQIRLVQFFHSKVPVQSAIAALCLRCYISHQIEKVCIDLVNRFGSTGNFGLSDLLPIVLDDALIRTSTNLHLRSPQTPSTYQSLATKVLQTFNPKYNTSLSTWVKHLVFSHKELNHFLNECGIYLISDWALLNDATAGKIRRALSMFDSATELEVQHSCHLLESYHLIYRQELQRMRLKGYRGRCPLPTDQQLQQIANDLQSKIDRCYSSQQILQQLQALAQKLRQRHPKTEVLSVEVPVLSANEDDKLQTAFLLTYRQKLVTLLDTAIAQTISDRLKQLKAKKEKRDRLFLDALHLFYVQGKTMGEIAPLIGLSGQSQVSRLLKLAELRTDIRHQLLLSLRSHVPYLAQQYTHTSRLTALDDQLTNALEAEVERVVAEDAMNAFNAHCTSKSLLAQRLCYYLLESA